MAELPKIDIRGKLGFFLRDLGVSPAGLVPEAAARLQLGHSNGLRNSFGLRSACGTCFRVAGGGPDGESIKHVFRGQESLGCLL